MQHWSKLAQQPRLIGTGFPQFRLAVGGHPRPKSDMVIQQANKFERNVIENAKNSTWL